MISQRHGSGWGRWAVARGCVAAHIINVVFASRTLAVPQLRCCSRCFFSSSSFSSDSGAYPTCHCRKWSGCAILDNGKDADWLLWTAQAVWIVSGNARLMNEMSEWFRYVLAHVTLNFINNNMLRRERNDMTRDLIQFYACDMTVYRKQSFCFTFLLSIIWNSFFLSIWWMTCLGDNWDLWALFFIL